MSDRVEKEEGAWLDLSAFPPNARQPLAEAIQDVVNNHITDGDLAVRFIMNTALLGLAQRRRDE